MIYPLYSGNISFAEGAAVSFVALGLVYSLSMIGFRIATFETENINTPISAGIKVLSIGALGLIPDSILTEVPLALTISKDILAYTILISEALLIRHIYVDVMGGRKFKKVDLTGKVYIVTGSNAGIGYETAKELVRMGATVVLACRSPEKAKAAKNQITKETNSNKMIVSKLDLCGFDSVRKFVKEFRATGLPLHGLINNAGVMMDERNLTQDGFEMVFTANHLSHFLLTTLLLPELEKTSGRIVVLSSSLYHIAKSFNFDNVMSEKHYSLFSTYSQSKLANILFAVELQRRLTKAGSKVTCNIVHPGAVRTEVTKNMNIVMQTLNSMFAPIMYAIQKTAAQGAYCSVHVATNPSLGKVGGRYFIDCVDYDLNATAMDPVAASRLWELSETLTGLKK